MDINISSTFNEMTLNKTTMYWRTTYITCPNNTATFWARYFVSFSVLTFCCEIFKYTQKQRDWYSQFPSTHPQSSLLMEKPPRSAGTATAYGRQRL